MAQLLRDTTNISGVYQIKNLVNGKVYVGSSVNVDRRWNKHIQRLRSGKHENSYLLNSWRKYGETNFEFSLLEETDINKCVKEEQKWMDKLLACDRNKGYNLYPSARSPLGHKYSDEVIEERKLRYKQNGHPWLGRKHSIETKKKMRAAKLGIPKSEEHKKNLSISRQGIKLSLSHKEAISKAIKTENNPNSKLTWEQVRNIRWLFNNEGASRSKLAREYSVGWTTVNRIVKNLSWKEAK